MSLVFRKIAAIGVGSAISLFALVSYADDSISERHEKSMSQGTNHYEVERKESDRIEKSGTPEEKEKLKAQRQATETKRARHQKLMESGKNHYEAIREEHELAEKEGSPKDKQDLAADRLKVEKTREQHNKKMSQGKSHYEAIRE